MLLADGRVIADGPVEEILAGGWYFATETARILDGAGGALLPGAGRRAAARRARDPGSCGAGRRSVPASRRSGASMSWQLASFATRRSARSAARSGGTSAARPPAKLIAVVATLAALAALGRDAFAAVPDVKPITAIVLVSGVAFGAGPGFAVGAIGGLASNILLGEGPWTPWQMLGWGLVGVLGALLARPLSLPRGRRGGRSRSRSPARSVPRCSTSS